MRWSDVAGWAGPAADNFGDGDWVERETADRMTGHRGVVLHIAEGTYAGTISWERNAASDVSSHFVSAKDGRAAQLVDTDDRPWTQGAGNSEWLSIEFEGYSGQTLTAQQLEFAARVLAKAHQVYGVPLQLADSPSGRGLGWHGMGGAAWGGHTNCPGAPIVAQRPAIIARAKAIVGGGDDLKDDEREWLANCVEILRAMASGDPVMWTKKRVKAQDQLNALDTRTAAMQAEIRALTAVVQTLVAGGTSVDTAAVLLAVHEVRELVVQEMEAARAEALAGVEARPAN